MKRKFSIAVSIVCISIVTIFLLTNNSSEPQITPHKSKEEDKARFHEERLKYEFDLVKNPVTGKIPTGIYEQERALAKSLPVKEETISLSATNTLNTTVNNTYLPAGPNNIGARTRAIAYDVRYGSGNQVIVAGSVSGGIMRSTNGGNNWTNVTPNVNDIHSFTAIVQDPRPGFQDTWYAGGGELYGNSASEIGATYFGWGLWKSTNNGASWNKLTFTIDDIPGNAAFANTLENFDHPFDFVYRLAVNPTNGHLYISCHRRVVRSTDAGASFQTVFGSAVLTNSLQGQNDVAVANDGRVLVAMNGGNPDISLKGVFISATGNRGSYVRIAGGSTLNVDSVANWRANNYEGGDKRILLTIAPSNQNIAYFFYENGLSSDAPDSKPEADLFRLDMAGTSTFTWSNRSENLPDLPAGNLSGSDPLSVQGGYDMVIKVKPDNPNVVFVGGVNLYRSDDGFTTATNTSWINGYRQSPLDYGRYPNGHADIHELVFHPTNPSEAICGNDGGIQVTSNITGGSGTFPVHPVSWTMLPNYQTLQYYHVGMDPDASRNVFVGGAQDNGTQFRDALSQLNTPISEINNHVQILGGDGTHVSMSRLNISDQNQYVYAASQLGNIRRIRITNTFATTSIRPNGLTPFPDGGSNEFGEFITNFRLDPDNTEDLYYVNFNRLFRTTAASSVTAGGWTELTGVGQAVNPGNPTAGTDIRIRAMSFSRGPYVTSHALYIGTTNGRIFRIDDPRNMNPTNVPVNITPVGLTGNVQDISVNPNNDDEIMAIVSNYGVVSIWHTTNAKLATPTWRSIEGNLALPSIRSCMIVVKKDAANQPATEYYVGTSIGLYSTTSISGTPTWQREGASTLNFAVVRSLAYRPVDNVMVIGTHGNGMFFASLGTPNFTPNLNTGINPITNDNNFIRAVFPTISRNIVQFRTGNLFTIKKIIIQLTTINGQQVYRNETGYQNGSVTIEKFAAGAYILSITSNDGKYRHIQKIIKP